MCHVKHKRTDALSLWHKQQSTTMESRGPLGIKREIRCLVNVSISCLASHTCHECLTHGEHVIGCVPTLWEVSQPQHTRARV